MILRRFFVNVLSSLHTFLWRRMACIPPILYPTIGDPKWIACFEDSLRELLPTVWTHPDNIDWVRVITCLAVMGVDVRTPENAVYAVATVFKTGIWLRENGLVKCNPHSVVRTIRV